MSAVAVTAANIGIANHQGIRLRSVIAGGALNGGDSVYIDTNGVAQKATSADATHAQLFGVCLPMASGSGAGKAAGGAGQSVAVVQWGEVEGFTLSGVAYRALVYLADDGTYATTAGTKTVPVGKVVPTSEKDASGNPQVAHGHDPLVVPGVMIRPELTHSRTARRSVGTSDDDRLTMR